MTGSAVMTAGYDRGAWSGDLGQVVGDVMLLVVRRPAVRGAVVVGVRDGRVGAEVDERSDELEVAVEGGLVEWGAPVGGIEVEADLVEKTHGVDAA